MIPEHVIKRPLVLTEKGNRMREATNKYLFEVDRRANKIDIKKAVETLFKVTVTEVNTLIVRGHLGRRNRVGKGHMKYQNWKKAIVAVKAGETIEFYEGT